MLPARQPLFFEARLFTPDHDQPDHHRRLATGVHLLNLLAVFFCALIFFFVEFDRKEWTASGQAEWLSFKRWQGIALTGAISSVALLMNRAASHLSLVKPTRMLRMA